MNVYRKNSPPLTPSVYYRGISLSPLQITNTLSERPMVRRHSFPDGEDHDVTGRGVLLVPRVQGETLH